FNSIEGKGTTFYFTVPYTPLRDIRPIRNLFGGHRELENKVRDIFLMHLGPIGENEFKSMEKIGLQYDVMTKYLDSLKKEGILGNNAYEIMKSELRDALKINNEELQKEPVDIEAEIIKAFTKKEEKADSKFIKEDSNETKRGQHKKSP
ncbi:MAG TPA: hypothetical protein VKE88_02430, partial [Candidatus Nanoarchaeia archaeon]|nr:hypothetical protein [Candidatus Nanoarchaeia archaeon]